MADGGTGRLPYLILFTEVGCHSIAGCPEATTHPVTPIAVLIVAYLLAEGQAITMADLEYSYPLQILQSSTSLHGLQPASRVAPKSSSSSTPPIPACSLQVITNNSAAKANASGLDHESIYMNRASQFQSVVPVTGRQTTPSYRDRKRSNDPSGIFQKLQPGYFKFNGTPESTIA